MANSTLISDYVGKGLASARPASLSIGAGALGVYYATDTEALSLWNGSGWDTPIGSVSTVVAGAGLSGGTITAGGTISLANINAGHVLANTGTAAATPADTSLSGLLDAALGAAQGDVIYRSATGWTVLAPGTSGTFLQTGGTGANPSWQAVSGATGGTVTQVVGGAGLHGTITASGTLTADWNAGSVSVLGSGLALSAGTLSATGSTGASPYIVSAFNSGTLSNAQVLLSHQFAKAVTFPANFGLASSGVTSYGAAQANATATATLTVAKCPAASDPTSSGSWTNVGTITVAAAGHAASFATTGTVAFAAGDLLRIVNQATADATLASLAITLAGDR